MFSNINNIVLKIVIAILSVSFFTGGHILSYQLVLFVLMLLGYSYANKFFGVEAKKPLLLLIAFYLIHVVGLIYSTNKENAYFDIEVKATLLIIPLFFIFTSKAINDLKLSILKLFMIASTISSVFLIIRALANYFNTKNSAELFYSNFSFILHPSYLSMYIILAIIFSFYIYRHKICKKQFIPVFSIIVNLTALILSNSKAGYISGIIVIGYLVFNFLYKKSKKYSILSLGFILVFGLVIISANSRIKTMLNVATTYEKTINNPNGYNEGTGLRILSWNAATELIKENYIIGVGTGDIKPELIKKYKELDYRQNIERNMNVHSQILETWLGQGLIGFILLILLFVYTFIEAVKQKNIMLQSFLILVFINFLFESMLNVQAGTIFFGFFFSFLVVFNDYKK